MTAGPRVCYEGGIVRLRDRVDLRPMGFCRKPDSYRWGSWLMALAVVPSILQGQDRSSNGLNGHAQAKARLDRAEWHLRMPSNVDSAMACFRSAISIWSALGDQDHLDSATLWVGNALLGSGHSDSAEVVMNAFLADLIERKDTADQAGALSVLGLIYYGQSDFPSAIEAYDKAEGYARATGQLVSSGRNLSLIHI